MNVNTPKKQKTKNVPVKFEWLWRKIWPSELELMPEQKSVTVTVTVTIESDYAIWDLIG
jgi:hypothetical protein